MVQLYQAGQQWDKVLVSTCCLSSALDTQKKTIAVLCQCYSTMSQCPSCIELCFAAGASAGQAASASSEAKRARRTAVRQGFSQCRYRCDVSAGRLRWAGSMAIRHMQAMFLTSRCRTARPARPDDDTCASTPMADGHACEPSSRRHTLLATHASGDTLLRPARACAGRSSTAQSTPQATARAKSNVSARKYRAAQTRHWRSSTA
jgi:hypothetical protein